jgi:hypothetical protein
MNRIIMLVLLISMIGCATTKKILHPVAEFFKPIHIELGMTEQEVIKEFERQPDSNVFYLDEQGFASINVWTYKMGQGLSAASNKYAKQIGGYEWVLHFKDGVLLKDKCYNFGY